MNPHNPNTINNSEPLSSVKYYDDNASAYIAQTKDADVSELQERFLAHIAPGGTILDLGCGSGRDSLEFMKRGYEVYAMDASTEMVFDGIWACASLLHVPRQDIVRIIRKNAGMIKPGGVFYMSFKLRPEDHESGGRVFTCFTESQLSEVLDQAGGFERVDYFVTQDVRPGRESEQWINAIAHVRRQKPE